MSSQWHILTGEFPPHCGGVGDHSALIARGLAERGCSVHVWQPNDPERMEGDVQIHAIGSFSFQGLNTLERSLNAFPVPKRLLVQYVPNAFGWRGANLHFCRWLLRRRRLGDDVRIFFHEPYFYFARQSLKRNLLAAVHRLMAWILLRAARTIYISNPGWEQLLRPYAPRHAPAMQWLPIPSTIPCVNKPDSVAAIRRSTNARWLVGHFGAYNDNIAPFLADSMRDLLRREPEVVVQFLGSGAERHAQRTLKGSADLAARVRSIGRLNAEEISLHLQALDLAMQPFPDGVSSRRTSAMACLINGVAMLSTVGELTESKWIAGPGVRLTPSGDGNAFVSAALDLLHNESARQSHAISGQELYQRCFALQQTLDQLLTDAPA